MPPIAHGSALRHMSVLRECAGWLLVTWRGLQFDFLPVADALPPDMALSQFSPTPFHLNAGRSASSIDAFSSPEVTTRAFPSACIPLMRLFFF